MRALPEGQSQHRDSGLVARCVEGFQQTYGRGWNIATRPYPEYPSCSMS